MRRTNPLTPIGTWLAVCCVGALLMWAALGYGLSQ